jgi:spermidine/putrescine transport system substrate-binding protein
LTDPRKLDRRGFLALTGAASLGALFAACGGGGGGEAAPAEPAAPPPAATTEAAPPAETTAPPATTVAGPKFDPASEPDGPVEFFEWAGYDDTAPWMWQTYLDSEYNAKSPLKFTFLENDIQALAKVASGYSPDVIHPCIAYWPDWNAAGLIQPFDTSLLPDYEGIPESVRAGGVDPDTGLVYHVPFDIGFSALVYRADKIPISTEEESWSILTNPDYKGKLALYSDEVTIIKIGALINAGEPIDPNALTSEQIQASKETMISQVKPNLRNFWDNNQGNIDDFINGNLWATYVWPDGYYQAKTKLKDVDVRYMWPKEGRLAWVCGFVLGANTERPGRSTLAVAAANTPQAAAALTDNFQYGSAQQSGVLELIQNKELIKDFSLDDPTAFAPPRAWFERPLPNRKEYVQAGTEVKAS